MHGFFLAWRVTSGVNSMCQPIFHTNRCIHIMQHLQIAEWTLMMLQVEETVIPSTTPVHSMRLVWEIYLMSGRSLWRKGATSLWEHLCNPHGNKTKKHRAAHSLAWPNAADTQRSGWIKTLISKKLTGCRGIVSKQRCKERHQKRNRHPWLGPRVQKSCQSLSKVEEK